MPELLANESRLPTQLVGGFPLPEGVGQGEGDVMTPHPMFFARSVLEARSDQIIGRSHCIPLTSILSLRERRKNWPTHGWLVRGPAALDFFGFYHRERALGRAARVHRGRRLEQQDMHFVVCDRPVLRAAR